MASSEGWKVRNPEPIQRWDPFTVWPTPGTSTQKRRKIETATISGVIARPTRAPLMEAKRITASPIAPKIRTFLK